MGATVHDILFALTVFASVWVALMVIFGVFLRALLWRLFMLTILLTCMLRGIAH